LIENSLSNNSVNNNNNLNQNSNNNINNSIHSSILNNSVTNNLINPNLTISNNNLLNNCVLNNQLNQIGNNLNQNSIINNLIENSEINNNILNNLNNSNLINFNNVNISPELHNLYKKCRRKRSANFLQIFFKEEIDVNLQFQQPITKKKNFKQLILNKSFRRKIFEITKSNLYGKPLIIENPTKCNVKELLNQSVCLSEKKIFLKEAVLMLNFLTTPSQYNELSSKINFELSKLV
jgi:hypothetical protein